MEYKKRTIEFLEKIAKLCDNEATDMIKGHTKLQGDVGEGIEALVFSTLIMNVHTVCIMQINNLNKSPSTFSKKKKGYN